MIPRFDAETCEALAALARAGDTEALRAKLGDQGANVVDGNDDSLLLLAAYYGHADTVRVLLVRGADPTLRNARGLSPLDGAAFKGFSACVDALVEGGAEVDDRGPDGRTALMWAAAFAREAALERLLAHGANRRIVDRAGLNAEEHARSMGWTALARVLASGPIRKAG